MEAGGGDGGWEMRQESPRHAHAGRFQSPCRINEKKKTQRKTSLVSSGKIDRCRLRAIITRLESTYNFERLLIYWTYLYDSFSPLAIHKRL